MTTFWDTPRSDYESQWVNVDEDIFMLDVPALTPDISPVSSPESDSLEYLSGDLCSLLDGRTWHLQNDKDSWPVKSTYRAESVDSKSKSPSPTPSSPGRSTSKSHSACDSVVICLFANCTSTFKRRADLDRHYKHIHNPAALKAIYTCDYPRCPRHKDPFNRRDHFRDHLREFHKEKIQKRASSSLPFSASDSDSSCVSTKRGCNSSNDSTSHHNGSWWRCGRCLRRVSFKEEGERCELGCGGLYSPKPSKGAVDGVAKNSSKPSTLYTFSPSL